MYRIELSPGDETVFRSIEELAVAIKRGVVTPRAHIYHNATSRWLPIQFHPHYKVAVSMPLSQAELVAGPPVKRLSSLSLEEPEEPESLPLTAPAATVTPSVAPPVKKKSARSNSAAKRPRRSSKPRRQLRIALVGALLIGGAQWVLSAPLFSRSDAPALIRAQRYLTATPAQAMKRVSLPNTSAMVPLPNSSASTADPLAGLAEPRPRITAPSFGGTASAVETRTTDVPATPAVSPVDSGTVSMVDSTGKKVMGGTLESVPRR